MAEMNYIENIKEMVSNVNGQLATVDKETAENIALINESFQNLVLVMTDSYLQAYQNKNYELINKMLREQRKLRKELTVELRKCQIQSILAAGKAVQTYNIFNKIAQFENEKKSFSLEMDIIMHSYRYAKETLAYLYRHSFVQHKKLMDELDIAASTLSDMLKAMIKTECVERIKDGKCSFYNLTNKGRKYVKDTVKDIDKEVIVDEDDFNGTSRDIVTGRGYFSARNSYRVCSFRSEDTNNKWQNENIWEDRRIHR